MIHIARDRSIIPACDTPLDVAVALIEATRDLDAVGAYKIGATLALSHGLPTVVRIIRDLTQKPIIYDHQKAGTDIPDTADMFMGALQSHGVDSVIIFPMAGPATQRAWVTAAQHHQLHVIVGGVMTHRGFLASDGGYVRDDAPRRIYEAAASSGVTSFVVPGTNPTTIGAVRRYVRKHCANPILFAPGFVRQGGKINDAARAAGSHWHAIVGRAIYEAPDMRKATVELCANL